MNKQFIPRWAKGLDKADIRVLKQEGVFPSTSIYAYLKGARRISWKRALKLRNVLVALGKPATLHELLPEVWGPNDGGPEE